MWPQQNATNAANEAAAQKPAAAAVAAPSVAAPSVAVLPFVYLGEDSTQAWTARAVADAITNGLSQVRGLRVASQAAAASLQRRIAAGDSSELPARALREHYSLPSPDSTPQKKTL